MKAYFRSAFLTRQLNFSTIFLPHSSFCSTNSKNNDQRKEAALLSAKIIGMISEFPNVAELRQRSLRQRILLEINKSENRDVSQMFKIFFQQGLILNYAIYKQQRVIQASQVNEKNKNRPIIFNPTHSVSGQIFRQIQFNFDPFIFSFGHYGISKTFSYILFQQLSNIIVDYMVQFQNIEEFKKSLSNSDKNFEKVFQNCPKLLYWTISKQMNSNPRHLMKKFRMQCSEIAEKDFPSQKQPLGDFLMQLKQYYEEKNIQVCLIIDQINTVASALRKGIQLPLIQKKKEEIEKHNIEGKIKRSLTQAQEQIIKQKDQIIKLEQKAYSLISKKQTILPFFDKVIYNSSANVQLQSSTQSQSSEKGYVREKDTTIFISSSHVQSKVMKGLKINLDNTHDLTPFYLQRIFYPELLGLESSALELTYMFMFELTRKKRENLGKIQRVFNQQIKTQVFNFFKDQKGKTIYTPLDFRDKMQNTNFNFNTLSSQQQIVQFIGKMLSQLKMKCQQNYSTKLKKYISKKVSDQYRIETEAIIYLNLIQLQKKRQKEKKNNFFYNKKFTSNEVIVEIRKEVFKNLQFLQNSIVLYRKDTILYDSLVNIDRHLFIGFASEFQLQKYIDNVIELSVKSTQEYQNIQKSLNLNQTQKKQKNQLIKQQSQKWKKHLCDEIGKSTQGKFPMGFYFIPTEKMIQYLEPSLYLMIQRRADLFKDVFFKKGASGSIFGTMIQESLKRALSKPTIVTIGKQSLTITEKHMFSSFPIKSAKNRQKMLDNFFVQFIQKFQNAQSDGCKFFDPQIQNAKAVDFVIVQSAGKTIFVKFYEVTIKQKKSDLIQKFHNFFRCYEEVTKNSSILSENNIKELEVSFTLISQNNNEKQLKQQIKQYNRILWNYFKLRKEWRDKSKQSEFKQQLKRFVKETLENYLGNKDQKQWRKKVNEELRKTIFVGEQIVQKQSLKEKSPQNIAEQIAEEVVKKIKQYEYLFNVRFLAIQDISFPNNKDNSRNFKALKSLLENK